MKGKAIILTASTEKGEITFKRTIIRLPTKLLTAKWKLEWKKKMLNNEFLQVIKMMPEGNSDMKKVL